MAVSLKKDIQEVLKEHEEELIAAIERVHPLENLAKSLYSKEVILSEDYNNFISLDPNPHHLDSALKARFLLHVALQNVKLNQSNIIPFIKILSSYEAMKLVTSNLLKQINVHEEDGRIIAIPLDDTIIVLEMHVNLLAEVLQDVSDKWEQIGVALNLKRAERKECNNCRTNSLKLHQILLLWYKKNDKADLRALKKALGSKIVAETAISNKFMKDFQEKILAMNLPEPAGTRSLKNYFHTVGSNEIQVSDGKSTIIEVKRISNTLEHYSWFKDDKALCDGLKYSGACQKVLLIKHACQGVEGVYSCMINKTESMKKTLIVNFSPEKSDVLEIYKRIPEISNDSWPPVGSSSFIKLALINENRLINSIHDDSVWGDMDDILKEKTVKQYESLFQNFENGTLILVEGRPGSGKTTLTRKLSKDWATKSDILIGAQLVFLISLRALNITDKESLTLSFILEQYYSSTDKQKEIEHTMEKNNGKDCCFIVDGLDEYKDRNTKGNLIYKLVNKQYLQHAMVIVASRPIGSVNLRRNNTINKRIEVLGFSKESIFDYVDSYFLQNEQDDQKGDQLKQYLKAHTNLLHMCYLPVHAAMICFIYQQPIEDIPVTETKMYECFTLLTIKRKLESDSLPMEYDTLSDIDGNILESFKRVCKLAFDMTMQSKQTIILSPTLSQNDSDVHSLGLVTIDKTAKLFGFKDLYSFLHLTFQEFFAAFYIKMCPVEKQLEIVTKNVDNKEMLNLWKFYCGLNSFDSNDRGLNKIMASKHSNNIYRIQCAFESQQKEVCGSIFTNSETKCLKFDNHAFLPIDLNALAFICSQTTVPVHGLAFNGCILNETEAQIFLDKVNSDRLDYITSLSFYINSGNAKQLNVVRLLLRKCRSLNEFRLENIEIGYLEVSMLIGHMKLPSLRYLAIPMPLKQTENFLSPYSDKYTLAIISSAFPDLEEVQYTYNGTSFETHQKCIIALLQSFKCKIRPVSEIPIGILSNIEIDNLERVPEFIKISNLALVNCHLFDSHLESLKNLVPKNLETLNLDCNKITCSNTLTLPQLLEKCTKLTHLSLSCNMINTYSAMAIASLLTPSVKLLELDLQGNNFGDQGSLALANAADKMHDAFRLILGNRRISHTVHERIQGTIKTVELNSGKSFRLSPFLGLFHPGSAERAMPCLKNLPTLNLSDRKISKSAFLEFAWGITGYCSYLQTLNLSFCKLEETSTLFKKHCVFSNLTSLNLSGIHLDKNSFKYFKDFNGFKILKDLNLSHNKLGDNGVEYVAYCFRDIKIEVLNLSNNEIGDKGAAALARWLRIGKKLIKFEKCNVTFHDQFKDTNQFLRTHNHVRRYRLDGKLCAHTNHQWHSSLLELDMSYNNIRCNGAAALGYGLKCCHNFQSLNLQNNEMEYGVVVLLKKIQHCPILSLNFDNNCLSLSPDYLWTLDKSQRVTRNPQVLIQGIVNFCNLNILKMENAHIGIEEVLAMSVPSKLFTKVEELRIGGNYVNCEKIVEEIRNNHNLKILHLQKNIIDYQCLDSLAEKMKCCHITDLNLSDTNLHKLHGARVLCEGLRHCSKVQNLNLSVNNLDSNDIKLLSIGLKNCKHMVVLNLCDNDIDSDGILHLAEVIKCFCYLRSINLGNNKIGEDGSTILMEALKNCIEIEQLQIQGNRIGPQGAAVIADWITCTSTKWLRYKSCLLSMLNLDGNQIQTDGALKIAAALQFCKKIAVLNMSNNEIGPRAANSLAIGLQNCANLRNLYLDHNMFRGECVTLLAAGLKYCHFLKILSLSKNKISQEVAVAMAKRLKHLHIKILDPIHIDICSDQKPHWKKKLRLKQVLEQMTYPTNVYYDE